MILQPVILWVFGAIFATLLVASAVTAWLSARAPRKDYSELRLRIDSWWMMVGLLAGVLIAGALFDTVVPAVAFLGFVSFLALKEYFSMIPTRRVDRKVLLWAYLAIPVQYYWVGSAWFGMFIIFIPVYMFLALPLRMVQLGETKGFLRSAGVLHWGLMTCVFSLSHAAYLLVLPEAVNADAGGGLGLLLFLLITTQLNDVSQYIWGKLLGNRKIIPKVSPGKTIAGFVGGIITCTILGAALGPFLTPLNIAMSSLAGLVIGIAGFIGDITISAIKRDIGVKDSGQLIPGHGGILDRVDSLTYTAPIFFHYVNYFAY